MSSLVEKVETLHGMFDVVCADQPRWSRVQGSDAADSVLLSACGSCCSKICYRRCNQRRRHEDAIRVIVGKRNTAHPGANTTRLKHVQTETRLKSCLYEAAAIFACGYSGLEGPISGKSPAPKLEISTACRTTTAVPCLSPPLAFCWTDESRWLVPVASRRRDVAFVPVGDSLQLSRHSHWASRLWDFDTH
ncbi:hypothetical protein V7S43_010904 [Phytophthora oleae]|uniref:Uncharacterized protein n=1 Tax=Phytophthora oleae TaxID=2107226 RepID=A0ABD3FBA8_9STRA